MALVAAASSSGPNQDSFDFVESDSEENVALNVIQRHLQEQGIGNDASGKYLFILVSTGSHAYRMTKNETECSFPPCQCHPITAPTR